MIPSLSPERPIRFQEPLSKHPLGQAPRLPVASPRFDTVQFRQVRFGKNLPQDVDPLKPETWRYGTYVLDNQIFFKVLADAKAIELLKIRPLTADQEKYQKRLQYWQRREATQLARIELLKHHDELKLRGTWVDFPQRHEIMETGDERLDHMLKTGYYNQPAYYRAGTLSRGLRNDGTQYPGLSTEEAKARRAVMIEHQEADLAECQANIQLLSPKVPCITERIEKTIPMNPVAYGGFTHKGDDFNPGDLYLYRITHKNGKASDFLTPDMWSKYQPEGVHGPSQVVDTEFEWPKTEDAYAAAHKDPQELTRMSLYNAHVGTVKKDATFADIAKMAPYLKAMGYTHVQLMPIGQFAGPYGWGYDQVGHFATHNAYGTPKELQKAVATLHAHGLGVIFDVVFNHFGPEGNYHGVYDPKMMNPKNAGWGHGPNFCYTPAMYFAKDYLKYLTEVFHADGFRWDQAQAILHPDKVDRNNTPLTDKDSIKHLTNYIHRDLTALRGKYLYVKAETHEHDPAWTQMHEMNGFGFHAKLNIFLQKAALVALSNKAHDGVNPDKWHFLHRLRDDLGWLAHQVVTLMSKDEVGNHHGKRLKELLEPDSRVRLAPITQYLLMRGIPQIFQGDEYGEKKSRFNYFTSSTDHMLTNNVAAEEWLTKNQVGLANNKSRYLRSVLSWQVDPAIMNLNRASNYLRLNLPAFYQDGNRHLQNFYFDHTLMHEKANDVYAMHRWGHPETRAGIPYKDEVYVLANYGNQPTDYTNETGKGLKVNLPAGQWVEILNTADPRYFAGEDGGSNPAYTNTGKVLTGGKDVELALAPHGAVVLRRLNKGWDAEAFSKEMDSLLNSPIPLPNGQEVRFQDPQEAAPADKAGKKGWSLWRR